MALELNLTKNTNTAIEGTFGKYYPRVEYKDTIDIKKLAKHMSEHTTSFSKGEILGMLTDMVSCIKELVLLGNVVKIDDLGLFKASVDGNGLTLKEGVKVSAGQGKQRTDEELAENVAVQQFAVNSVKLIMQATGETTMGSMSQDATLKFTSKAKQLIATIAGGGSVSEDGGDNGGGDGSPAAPQISGTSPFESSTEVTISSSTSGAQIYYTVDGSQPTQESSLYSSPLTISATTTVKAIAVKDNVESDVVSETFTKSAGSEPPAGGDDNVIPGEG